MLQEDIIIRNRQVGSNVGEHISSSRVMLIAPYLIRTVDIRLNGWKYIKDKLLSN